jgi:hypothetical protein
VRLTRGKPFTQHDRGRHAPTQAAAGAHHLSDMTQMRTPPSGDFLVSLQIFYCSAIASRDWEDVRKKVTALG